MRINILIDASGNYVNPEEPLINYAPLNGTAGSSLFFNQITVEFYNGIVQQANGTFTPDNTKVVTNGLTGTLQFKVWASANSPYPVDLTQDTINIANSCMLQWTGITEALDITPTSIVGATYINILLDRN
jgi:hypothetical protein